MCTLRLFSLRPKWLLYYILNPSAFFLGTGRDQVAVFLGISLEHKNADCSLEDRASHC